MVGKMKNNSSLDYLKDVDILEEIPHLDFYLSPGDSLYIPRWWWHLVIAGPMAIAEDQDKIVINNSNTDSDRFSFSVNFWWGSRIEK